MRDLDFGRQIIDYLKQLEWPDGVVVEDLSLAAPLVLHRLQELRPAKLVLVGAVPRDVDPPATLRRRHLDLQSTSPDEVQRRLADSMMEMVDIDHTMGVVRHWGEAPADTVVIEVEPAETSFGPGFSEELAGCVDPILDMVRLELAGVTDGSWLMLNFDAGDLSGDGPAVHSGTAGAEPQTSGSRARRSPSCRRTPPTTLRPGWTPISPPLRWTGSRRAFPGWRWRGDCARGACSSRMAATGSMRSPSSPGAGGSWWGM